MKLHAFVAMPFGSKPGPDGQVINFNQVYDELIKPALEAAGLEVIRADEEERAGDIRTDMFQELLIADLVVADLTLPNPNVWYELGTLPPNAESGYPMSAAISGCSTPRSPAAWTRCASSACDMAVAETGRVELHTMYNEVKRRTGHVSWIDIRVPSEDRGG